MVFREYVVHYTNASVIFRNDFKDTEDLDGLFSGWDAEKKQYDTDDLALQGVRTRAIRAVQGPAKRAAATPRTAAAKPAPTHQYYDQDPTLQNPRCVFQVLKRHFSRYTPEMVERSCGMSQECF